MLKASCAGSLTGIVRCAAYDTTALPGRFGLSVRNVVFRMRRQATEICPLDSLYQQDAHFRFRRQLVGLLECYYGS
jgi:hypothetical protein